MEISQRITVWLLIIFLIFAALAESTLFIFPAVFVFSLLLYLVNKSKKILMIILLLSIMFDSLGFGRTGVTPIFVFIACLITDIYRRNFDAVGGGIFLPALLFLLMLAYTKTVGYPVRVVLIESIILFGSAFLVRRILHMKTV